MTHVLLLLLGVLTFDLMNLVRKVHSVVWSVVVFWRPLLCPCVLEIIVVNEAFMFLNRAFLINPVCRIDVLEFLTQVITKKEAGKTDMFSTNLLIWLI